MSAVKAMPKPPPSPPAPSRMSLQALVKGKRAQPVRVMVYGPEGIGKSTFGASAPKPIFLASEDGTQELDVTRFPAPSTWTEVLDAVRVLTLESHDFETLVVDTLDWLEPLLWAHICARDKQENVEAYGYGKGYQVALDEWRVFVNALEGLRRTKPMHVVFLAHSWVKTFKNPEGEDFDRYELKVNLKAAGLLKEWSDAVLFANYETFTSKDVKTKRVKGQDTGARLVHTERRAAFDAKNRYRLPETLPLSWGDFMGAVELSRAGGTEELVSDIKAKLAQLGGKHEADGLKAIQRAAGDTTKLAQLSNWANFKLAEKAEGEKQ